MCARPANPHTRDALLDAARTEFALHGLDAARLEDITRHAGVSKGAFYLHFRTKREAYRHILEQFFAVLEDEALRHQRAELEFVRQNGPLTSEDVSQGTARFHAALEVECSCDTDLLEMLWRNRKILAILDSSRGSEFLPILVDFRRRMADLVVHGGFGAKAASRLRGDIDPAVVGDVIVGAYESFARRMRGMRRKPNLRDWARSLLIVVRLGAMQPPDPGSEDHTPP